MGGGEGPVHEMVLVFPSADYPKALPLLSALVGTSTYSQAGVWVKHATCQYVMNDLEGAAMSFSKVLSLAPGHTDSRYDGPSTTPLLPLNIIPFPLYCTPFPTTSLPQLAPFPDHILLLLLGCTCAQDLEASGSKFPYPPSLSPLPPPFLPSLTLPSLTRSSPPSPLHPPQPSSPSLLYRGGLFVQCYALFCLPRHCGLINFSWNVQAHIKGLCLEWSA